MDISYKNIVRNFFLVLVLSLALAACGGSDNNTTPGDKNSGIEPEAAWGGSTWGVGCWGQPCT